MKIKNLLIVIITCLLSCTNDNNDDYIIVKGRVERSINGVGIPYQNVYLSILKLNESEVVSASSLINSYIAKTDANGNFSISIKNVKNVYCVVEKPRDEYYNSYELTTLNLNNDIILKVNKFIKFKVTVKNINPINENDYVSINFNSGNQQNFIYKIENFGSENFVSPNEEETEQNIPAIWNGINVNSIVYFNVDENAPNFKINSVVRKSGVETSNLTPNLEHFEDKFNEYTFEY